MNKLIKYWLLIAKIAFLLIIPALSNANSDVERLTENPANWATWGGNYAATRYSTLAQINTDNVSKLTPAWTFSTGVLRGHEGGPLIVKDIIYIHTPFPNTVYALDQKTQAIIWEYTPSQNADVTIPVMCCDSVNRGLAYGDGKVFLQQNDTVLTALDAKTGKRVWSVQNGDPKLGMTNTNAPLVVKDNVITGISGSDYGVRGFLAAYNIKTGKIAWKGYSIGEDSDMLIDPNKTTTWLDGKVQSVGTNTGMKSWQNNRWQIGGGATWGWYSYDPKLNLIYYGSGNPVSFNPMTRPGDNKWTNALWARDADTGVVKWVYQMTPHDEWGFDGVNESVLIDQDIQGKPRKTLVHFDHNGFAYVLDRETGELLKADKFDQSVNWASHIDLKTGRPQLDLKYSTEHHGEEVNTHDICPSLVGAKGQQPVSYSPQTGLFYVSGVHLCQDLEPYANDKHIAGQSYIDTTISLRANSKDAMTGVVDEEAISEANDYLGNLGQLTAFDAKTGKIAWSNKERFMVGSGSLSTAGGLLFYGTSEGYFKVLDAKSGKELYQFKTPSGIVGNVNTWSFKGKQYLGVLSGIGGWAATAEPSSVYEQDKKFYTDFSKKIDAQKDPAKKAELEKKLQMLSRESTTRGYHSPLGKTTRIGGTFTVFALPN